MISISTNKKRVLLELVSGMFILLFLYTAISKLSNIDGFISVLSRSPLIGEKAPIFAWALPIIEIIIATLLFLPRFRKWGMYLSTMIMLLFTGYIFYMVNFTPDLPCSCGGVLKYLSWKQHLVFNIFFLLLGLSGIWLTKKTNNSPSSPTISTSYS